MRKLRAWATTMVGTLALLLAMAPVFAAAPSQSVASGADLTWGYGYSRSRVSVIPPAYDALGGVSRTAGPWVVPAPIAGYHSQSTPVVDGNRIFFFAFYCPNIACTVASTAALFESDFGPTGAPGPAREIASFQPSSNTNYASPSDPAISPNGQWLAFAAGPTLYWWPITATGVGQEVSRPITPQNVRAGVTTVGSSPVFVPDAQPGSGGWAVCSGDSVGAFSCYAVEGAGSYGTMPGPYLTRSATTAITSSAVYVPGGVAGHPADTTCFGVASWARSRIECLNPFGAGHIPLGVGYYKSPIDSALAYAGGDLWATGQNGGLYALSARTGVPAGADQGYDTAGMSIAPPSVDVIDGADLAAAVQDKYGRLCWAAAGAPSSPAGQSCLPSSYYTGQLTAPTIVPGTSPGCVNIWDNTDSNTLFEVENAVCSDHSTHIERSSAATGMGLGHNFSALDVGVGPGSQYVVAWSDGAVPWEQDGGVTLVGSVPPFEGQPSPGGLEIWHLRTPLDVWPLEPNAPAGGTECILAASYQGGVASISVTWDGKQYAMTPVETVPPANPNLPGAVLTSGPSIQPISGCTVPSQDRSSPNPLWAPLQSAWSGSSSKSPSQTVSGNVPPSQWGTTSWTTQIWVARVPVPATPPAKPIPAKITAIETFSHTPYMPGPLNVSVVCAGASGGAASTCQAAREFGVAAFVPNPNIVQGTAGALAVVAPAWATGISVYTPGTPSTGTLGATGSALFGSAGGTGPLFSSDGIMTPCSASPPVTTLAQRIRGLLSGQVECGSSYYLAPSASQLSSSVSVSLPSGVASVEDLGGRAYRLFLGEVSPLPTQGHATWVVDVYAGSQTIEVLHPIEYSACLSPKVAGAGGQCVVPCPTGTVQQSGQCVPTSQTQLSPAVGPVVGHLTTMRSVMAGDGIPPSGSIDRATGQIMLTGGPLGSCANLSSAEQIQYHCADAPVSAQTLQEWETPAWQRPGGWTGNGMGGDAPNNSGYCSAYNRGLGNC